MQKVENRMQVIKDQEDLFAFHISAIKVEGRFKGKGKF